MSHRRFEGVETKHPSPGQADRVAHAVVGRAPWRADTAHVRWLILSALGFAGACGGEAGEAEARGGNQDVSETSLEARVCSEPRSDQGGGFERCGDGTVHRTSVGICPSRLPQPGASGTSNRAPGGEAPSGIECTTGPYCCSQDADCTERPHGFCNYADGSGYCNYGCVSDDDCGSGMVCRCGVNIGLCEPASCRSDADCADGLLCSEYDASSGCGGKGMACQTEADECSSATDCDGQLCALEPPAGPNRVCHDRPFCPGTSGRPFLVAGAARLAPVVERADWYAAPAELPSAAVSSAALRAALVEGWLQQASMEHASVAAFARFSLELMGLGAPPELLAGAASAMLDEIRHARGCFELARRHSGADVGPGPLPLDDALLETDLTSIVLGTIAEGCIGETIAALEAAEVLSHTEDPAARLLLEQIAREEATHAQLAWRFLAWALETGPASLRGHVERAFAAELAAAPAPIRSQSTDPALSAELLRHGLADAPLRQALRTRALRDVVGPCAATLLERERVRHSPCSAAAGGQRW